MDKATRVQIRDKAVCISHGTNAGRGFTPRMQAMRNYFIGLGNRVHCMFKFILFCSYFLGF